MTLVGMTLYSAIFHHLCRSKRARPDREHRREPVRLSFACNRCFVGRACVELQKDDDENAERYEIFEFVKNDKGKVEGVLGSGRRASESCWRPLRLLNRNRTRLEKVHKECFAQTVDGAPSTAPSFVNLVRSTLSVNFFGSKKRPAGKK